MKEDPYTEIICRKFCRFYKGDKEEMQCGTYTYLQEAFGPGELARHIPEIPLTPSIAHDDEIRGLICSTCDFLEDGCDFRDGLDSPPCGGYTIIEYLLNRDLIKNK